jgi:uncharacterized protein YcaQ
MGSLSHADARRIALVAQGFGSPPPAPLQDIARTGRRSIHAAVRRLGAIQIDSVNVLVRSHYLPLFSRLGPYPRELLDEMVYGAPRRRKLFEYWGHEASLLPLDAFPLLRWRMHRATRGQGMWKHVAQLALDKPELVRRVEAQLRDRGPLGAGELTGDTPRTRGPWWGWSEHKRALEYLFWSGRITTRTRRNFERVYDLVERVIPGAILARPTLSEEDQHRELLTRAAKALGVATVGDLADYFRLPRKEARARVGELVQARVLGRVAVEGWAEPAYVPAGVAAHHVPDAVALLSPFDSLIWNRARTERLFGFHFRLEIYTPAHLRVHGYYVLPFLLGDRLVARVDLKSDRAESTLVVRGLHVEPSARRGVVVPPLRDALGRLASWLGLERMNDRVLRRRSKD